jgi:hypothetical protein
MKQQLNEEFKRMQKLAGIVNESQPDEAIDSQILDKFIDIFDTSEGYQGPLDSGTERSVIVDINDYIEDGEEEYENEIDIFNKCYEYLQSKGGKIYYPKYKTTFEIISQNEIEYSWKQE